MLRSPTAGLSFLLGISLIISSMPLLPASAKVRTAECTIIGDNLMHCGEYGRSPYIDLHPPSKIVINYPSPFADPSGVCRGRIIEKNLDGSSTIVVKIFGSRAEGCPYRFNDEVTYFVEPFFVFPESPIGSIAMIVASMGALGGFLYFKVKKTVGKQLDRKNLGI